jgi:hypothetical protein
MCDLWRTNPVQAVPILLAACFALLVSKGNPSRHTQRFQAHLLTRGPQQMFVQEDESDENEVSTDEVEKYVSVYKSMQRNRNMTVDQAAAAQGLTTKQFRELEDRIQRDDAALEQARDELQAAARASTPGESPIPTHH